MEVLWRSPQRIGSHNWHTIPQDQHVSFQGRKVAIWRGGATQGGRGGRPWGRDHARKRRVRLTWWEQHLHLDMVTDLHDSLPRVEAALRELHTEGRAGK